MADYFTLNQGFILYAWHGTLVSFEWFNEYDKASVSLSRPIGYPTPIKPMVNACHAQEKMTSRGFG